MGNQFLGYIRSADAIAFVLRAFTASEVSHVEGEVDPLRDLEILESELTLADLATVDRRLERSGKTARAGAVSRVLQAEVSGLTKVRQALDQGLPARRVSLSAEEQLGVRDAQLLTAKPVIFVGNVDEDELAGDVSAGAGGRIAAASC